MRLAVHICAQTRNLLLQFAYVRILRLKLRRQLLAYLFARIGVEQSHEQASRESDGHAYDEHDNARTPECEFRIRFGDQSRIAVEGIHRTVHQIVDEPE